MSITPYDTTTALSFSIVLWTHNLRCSEFIELTFIMVCPFTPSVCSKDRRVGKSVGMDNNEKGMAEANLPSPFGFCH